MMALHTLLAIEGHSTHIETLQALLPATDPTGCSMSELKDAARACGLSLIGIKFARSELEPDRPALVYLRLEDPGHFLVVRPVGQSGKLVQVIDTTGDPVVMDAVDLYASPIWTGLTLIPVRPNWPLRIAVGMMVVCGLTFVLPLAASRSLAAREGTPHPSVSADSDRVA